MTGRPRLVGLLSWYDESASWLAACVASLGRVVDHLVAVDGAYMLFPGGKPQSPSLQAEVVTETARAAGIGLTLHRPQTVWFGNEVEKRSFMFRLGSLVAREREDWFLIVDADEIVTDAPFDLREQLADTDLDVATYELWQKEDWFEHVSARVATSVVTERENRTPVRGLVRALPGLRVEGRHFDYLADTDAGTVNLWGEPALVPALYTNVRVEHRVKWRDGGRRDASETYYRRRDAYEVERVASR